MMSKRARESAALSAPISAFDKLPDEQKRELERNATNISDLFSANTYDFILKAPEKLTVLKGGAYSKKPYIGEEEFTGVRAYVGKSGKVIVVFQDKDDSATQVEIPLNEMLTKLHGVSIFSNDLAELRDNRIMESARADGAKIESLAHEQAERVRQLNNPAFGSW